MVEENIFLDAGELLNEILTHSHGCQEPGEEIPASCPINTLILEEDFITTQINTTEELV